ncbi:unnamed protein product, partial [Discosporangium mesarthrocarpum]
MEGGAEGEYGRLPVGSTQGRAVKRGGRRCLRSGKRLGQRGKTLGGQKGSAENKERVGEGGEKEDRMPLVTTVEELRRFFQREGSVVGHKRCMWADDFAHLVVAERLQLAILFVDMERAKDSWPYRVLATCEGEPDRYVLLKREGPVGHFVLITHAVRLWEEGAGGENQGGPGGAFDPSSRTIVGAGRGEERRGKAPS